MECIAWAKFSLPQNGCGIITNRLIKEHPYGCIAEIKTLKGRFSPPEVPDAMTIIYGKGISNAPSYFNFLMEKGLVKRAGAWYTISLPGKEPIKIQSEDRAVDWVRDNIDDVKEAVDSLGGYTICGIKAREKSLQDSFSDNADDDGEDFCFEEDDGVLEEGEGSDDDSAPFDADDE